MTRAEQRVARIFFAWRSVESDSFHRRILGTWKFLWPRLKLDEIGHDQQLELFMDWYIPSWFWS